MDEVLSTSSQNTWWLLWCTIIYTQKVHVEEAGMTAYLFKLNTEKTIYCKNVT